VTAATRSQPPARLRLPRAERSTQLLDVAEQVFLERGYAATSMDDVAERAGVSKPVLYDHFGSKEGLLVATYARSRSLLLASTTSAVQTGGTPEERLRRGFAAFFAFVDEHPVAAVALREDAGSGVPGEQLAAIREQQSRVLADLLAAECPLLPGEALEPTAELLMGACERLAVWRAAHPGTSADDAAGHLMRLAWDGLAALRPARRAARPRLTPSRR